MPHKLETIRPEGKSVEKLVPLAPFLAVIAATAAFVFGLIAKLSWEEDVAIILASVALAVGAIFTILEIQRLGNAAKWIR